jgi:hypothetical protein
LLIDYSCHAHGVVGQADARNDHRRPEACPTCGAPLVDRAHSANAYADGLEDIEAYLVERELSARLAPTVAGLIDVSGWSLERAVAEMRLAFQP